MGSSSTDGHAQTAQIVHDPRIAQRLELPTQILGHALVELRKAFDVHLVDDRLVPRNLRAPLGPPGEGRIDHPGLRDEGRAVAHVERQVLVLRANGVAEQGIVPFQGADELLRIGVDEKLVRIEAMAGIRLIRPVNPETIDRPGSGVGEIAVPDLIGVFGEIEALGLGIAVVVE